MSERSQRRLKFSIVIPFWQEAQNLAVLLPRLCHIDHAETIVVEASADPQSERIAHEYGAKFFWSHSPNRGEQMNRGAQAALGDVLIFQHADSELTAAHLFSIDAVMQNPDIIGGAFYRKFDARHPRLRFLDWMARFRSRHGGMLFGDQSIFVRREVFQSLGGFAAIPLMEDVEFSRRLRAFGQIVIIDPPVQTSARRHLRGGAWRTTIQNGAFLLLYKVGVSPKRLHRWYYQDRQSSQLPTEFASELMPADRGARHSARSVSRNPLIVSTRRSRARISSSLSSRASAPTQTK